MALNRVREPECAHQNLPNSSQGTAGSLVFFPATCRSSTWEMEPAVVGIGCFYSGAAKQTEDITVD